MSEESTRDAKLVQYLNEAYAKEKELETSLQAHIEMAAARKPYQKRLKEHLKETKNHAKLVERRIKKLGGDSSTLGEVAGRAIAAAKGPLHALRGTGDEEKLLKNAKTEYSEEHEEIATYTAIETLAEELGDKETAKVARQIRREEERMARFLEKQIPVLTRAVAKAEVPAAERKGGSSRKRSGGSSTSRSRGSSASKRGGSSSSSRSKKSGSSSSSRSRSASSSRAKSGSSARAKSGSSSRGKSKSSSRRSSGSASKRRSGSRS